MGPVGWAGRARVWEVWGGEPVSQEGPGSAGWPWGTSGRQRVGLGPGKWRGIARVSVGRVRAIL